VAQSIILFLVALFLLLNMVVDGVYVIIDPRIRAAAINRGGRGGSGGAAVGGGVTSDGAATGGVTAAIR
jgi:peptide/nickel transport system permease protein